MIVAFPSAWNSPESNLTVHSQGFGMLVMSLVVGGVVLLHTINEGSRLPLLVVAVGGGWLLGG